MRRLNLTFTALLLPFDFCALLGAAVTAYFLRFSPYFISLRPVLTNVPFAKFFVTSITFAFIWILLLAISGLYTIDKKNTWSEFSRIVLACTAGIMIVIATVFFQREFTTSRFIVLAVWPIAIAYVWFGRLFLCLIRAILLRARLGHQRLIIIGDSKAARDLAALYRTRPSFGCTIIKIYRQWNESSQKEIESLAKKRGFDLLLLADTNIARSSALEIIALSEVYHFTFRYLADLFAARIANIEVTTINGIPIIEVKRTPLDGWGRIAKRAFDVIVSLILIIIFSPIMILSALAILIESRGGIFFSKLPKGEKTERVGEGGKPFHYFKFRSMRADSHWERYASLSKLDIRKGDPLVKIKNDPRVTRVGRFIRKWSLDELPELFLVLLGRMSLVGPRPHLPEEVDKYKPEHRRVLAIKPGITGIAQTSGRSDLDFEDEVRLDAWYIEHWSLWRDLGILLKTPWVVITHKGMEDGV